MRPPGAAQAPVPAEAHAPTVWSANPGGRNGQLTPMRCCLTPPCPKSSAPRRRLVGAIALVVAAIVVLPMVLDSHPKPVTDDISIDIPSRPAPRGPRVRRRRRAGRRSSRQSGASRCVSRYVPGVRLRDCRHGAGSRAGRVLAAERPGGPRRRPASERYCFVRRFRRPKRTAARRCTSASGRHNGQQARRAAGEAGQAGAVRPANHAAGRTTRADRTTHATHATRCQRHPQRRPWRPPPMPIRERPRRRRAAGSRCSSAVFPDEASARNWIARLKAAGVPAYTERRRQADGSTRTLLRAGPFADRDAASAAIARVREAGLMSGASAGAAQ